jgi:hypothetical protein
MPFTQTTEFNMLKRILIGAAVFAMAGAANAAEMKKCDDATMAMVMKEVEAAPAANKEMAMKEFAMAKEKMAAKMMDDCSKHLDAASTAAMKK